MKFLQFICTCSFVISYLTTSVNFNKFYKLKTLLLLILKINVISIIETIFLNTYNASQLYREKNCLKSNQKNY